MGSYFVSNKNLTEQIYARLSLDAQLAKNIRNHASNEHKTITLYGSAHGSDYDDGIPEVIEDAGLRFIKIDTYTDNNSYMKICQEAHTINAMMNVIYPDNTIVMGEDFPDLIYFLDTETVHFTDETPDHIRALVMKLVKIPEPDFTTAPR